jgi:hypothetical protein
MFCFFAAFPKRAGPSSVISSSCGSVSPRQSRAVQSSEAKVAVNNDVTLGRDISLNVSNESMGNLAWDSKQVSSTLPVDSAVGTRSLSAPRRPAKSGPSGPSDAYREWVKGKDVRSLIKSKLSASSEARRLKLQQSQEDERRALQMMWRKGVDENDDHFDALGANNLVYLRLRDDCKRNQMSDDGMDDVL